ncbi:MAG TPA: phosphoglycerate mutase family protein, partial [Methylomirabilota bacterium]
MRLLIIRHAAAVPRGTPGIPDDDRPLTPKGEAKFRVAAQGLARITDRPDVLLTSPLPRARVTADIAARAFERLEPRVEPALAHGGVDAILAALAHQPPEAMVAIVGHEPVLGALLARLLGAPGGEQFP